MDTKFSKSPTYKRILLRVLRIFMIVGMFCALISCKKQMQSTPRILQKDDNLNSMVVTTGIKDAPPLEAFCNFEIDEDLNNTIDCQVPLLPKLAIGHMIGLTDGPLQELDWSKVDWQITLDGYLLDMDTFEEQSYVEPVVLSSPSPVREGFKQKKTWDIVLLNPNLGMHTLVCTVIQNSIAYNWVVNFEIRSTVDPVNTVDPLLKSTPDILDSWDKPVDREMLY